MFRTSLCGKRIESINLRTDKNAGPPGAQTGNKPRCARGKILPCVGLYFQSPNQTADQIRRSYIKNDQSNILLVNTHE